MPEGNFTMRIAVCDDEREMRDEIKNALAEILPNASVSTFDDGNCLLAEHGETAFDIIILDILMPKISGLDTAALLREMGVTKAEFTGLFSVRFADVSEKGT